LFGSLLLSYEAVLHSLYAAAHLTKTSVTPDAVIRLVTDEYDRRTMKKARDNGNEAFTAATLPLLMAIVTLDVIECYNCHKKGNIKAECWVKGGGKEGQGQRRGSVARGNAIAAAAEIDIEAWALMDECTDTEASCWTEDNYDEAWATLEEAESDKEGELADAGRVRTSTVEVELYDSGASRHMSPSRDEFSSYRLIEPRPIGTADKCVFYAIGVGNLEIDMPNGGSSTRNGTAGRPAHAGYGAHDHVNIPTPPHWGCNPFPYSPRCYRWGKGSKGNRRVLPLATRAIMQRLPQAHHGGTRSGAGRNLCRRYRHDNAF
jgi:hypothetical protein